MADTWCSLCEGPLAGPFGPVWEVGILGPDRRVHASCWGEIGATRPLPAPFWGRFFRELLAREAELGLDRSDAGGTP